MQIRSSQLIFPMILLVVMLTSCRFYGEPLSYTSPDGRYIVDIISEDQLSNDHDPYWQHISIRNSIDTDPVKPGNLYCVSSYEQPSVIWPNSDTVVIELFGRYGQSFKEEAIESLNWEDVYIKMKVTPFEENKP